MKTAPSSSRSVRFSLFVLSLFLSTALMAQDKPKTLPVGRVMSSSEFRKDANSDSLYISSWGNVYVIREERTEKGKIKRTAVFLYHCEAYKRK